MTKVRMGMVGGGPDAFIGQVHRMAAGLDGNIELVCGVFSRDQQKNRQAGESLLADPARAYADIASLFAAEQKLPAEQRMEFVSIVTPNSSHHAIASAAIDAGFHVFCEKPATFTLAESVDLQRQLQTSPVLFGLAHTYTGYPLVKEARQRVANGELGEIKKVVVEYSQGWLAKKLNNQTSKQGSWRLDPTYAGVSCCVGDIGVHAANLAEYIIDSPIKQILADLGSVEADRSLDDDATVLLRFANQARGVLIASQISLGEENNLNIKVYGSQGSLSWSQQEPNSLWLMSGDQPAQLLRTGFDYLCDQAKQCTRTPAGHPEGYIEAFANLYQAFANGVKQHRNNPVKDSRVEGVPDIEHAVSGMQFIEGTVTSSQANNSWLKLDKLTPAEHTK
ncbi:Gfo/Idh/MocA family protein [Neptunicella sp. SCSIO 80796]|uniref:Gfo/Idh/MocA family protein n=1 Tax=Neptunicella plasticusilytica TaxID=3117012 RepID=UPI003A4D54A2